MSLSSIFCDFLEGSTTPEHTAEKLARAYYGDNMLRPCEADGKPAIFHRWVEEDKALLQFDLFAKDSYMEQVTCKFKEESYAPAGTRITHIRQTFALVEYPDGSVGKVEPELITFTDRRAE